ncbi:MAG: hypothetical protein NVS9B8_13280 [Candidatus Limnocylindrales bacterium]
MFSTLLGPLPPDPDHRDRFATDHEAPRDAVDLLAASGLELVTDGAAAADPNDAVDDVVGRWQSAAARSPLPVKQVLLGPYSGASRTGENADAVADRLRAMVMVLATAGCPFIEIAEPEALAIGTDPAEAAVFAAAHRRLLDGVDGLHLSLAMTGGNIDGAGPAVFFDLAYASYAFDLIAGPDNWRLIAQAPPDRGIICGALSLADEADETRDVLVWAAHYAASTGNRGLARIGLANAPALRPPTRQVMLRKLAIVAEASRIASVESAEDMAGLLDPRAIDRRAAAFGRFAQAQRRTRPRP